MIGELVLESSWAMAKGSNNPNFGAMIRQRRVTEWGFRSCKIKYDDEWRELMREVSVKLGYPKEDIERINSAWWRYVSEMMANPILPTIRIVYLCTLKPNVKILFRYCEKVSELVTRIYRGEISGDGRTIGDAKKMELHLRKLHDTYFRLEEEAVYRKKVRGDMRKRKYEAGTNELLDKLNEGYVPLVGTSMRKSREYAKQLKEAKNESDDIKN